jgi:hypothetical protein
MIVNGYTGACLWFKRRLIRAKGLMRPAWRSRVNCDASTHGG